MRDPAKNLVSRLLAAILPALLSVCAGCQNVTTFPPKSFHQAFRPAETLPEQDDPTTEQAESTAKPGDHSDSLEAVDSELVDAISKSEWRNRSLLDHPPIDDGPNYVWIVSDPSPRGAGVARPSDHDLFSLASHSGPAQAAAAVRLARRFSALESDSKSDPTFDGDRTEELVAALKRIVFEAQPIDSKGILPGPPEDLSPRPPFNNPDDSLDQIPLRAAAAESWCVLLAASGSPRQTLQPAARALTDDSLPAEVRAALLRMLSHEIRPERIRAIDQFLTLEAEEVAVELRRAAVEACWIDAVRTRARRSQTDQPSADIFEPHDWPVGLEHARFDPDPKVRMLLAEWAVAAGSPETADILNGQLRDRTHEVRSRAIGLLAKLNTPQARRRLNSLAGDDTEPQQDAAVRALAHFGATELVPFAGSSKMRIRRSVAEALSTLSDDPVAARLATELILDRDHRVQSATAHALSEWPAEAAVPVLLRGLSSPLLKTRRQCLATLREKTGCRDGFPLEGTLEEREEAVERLARSHGWVTSAFELAVLSRPNASAANRPDVDPAALQLARIACDLDGDLVAKRTARQDLLAIGPTATVAVEHLLTTGDSDINRTDAIEILAEVDPVYAALQALGSSDVLIRRAAMIRLARSAAGRSLTPTAAGLLSEHLQSEPDAEVWRAAMLAISQEASPEAEQIVLIAAGHRWHDVRRMSCDYAVRHRRPHFARWLMPLLADSDATVRSSAARASGMCGNPILIEGTAGAAGCVDLLSDPDSQVRLQAAAALARFDDPRGTAGLLRAARTGTSTARIEAISVIAEAESVGVVPELIRICWTERDRQVLSHLLDTVESLVPKAEHPTAARAARSDHERQAAWSDWLQSRA
ncbi:HEAT repeat domain-containing protein [Stratiformator vulcanicus]|uniref:HEAT repeat protein n=1 Tax=Stratiformator vulcanicus TaxID=2527980 RepID=A0A517QW97_9PLAN|nr:HEAT repeat domain-containing protein [Stratiformator vulcanicus]QDT35936.1 hypothetical protein Pan189_02890 [Stratiformator vulcanicus]